MGNGAEFDWDDMKLLLAVVRSGSFNRAAATLHTSQSRVSRRLAVLEDMLGVQLFDRSVEGVTPTEAAMLLMPAAEKMEQAAYSLLTSVTGVDQRVSGSVRVAADNAISNYVLLPNLNELRTTHPGLTLELSPSSDIINMSRNEADLALRFVRPTRGDLVVKRVGTVTMGLFTAAESRWATMKPEDCDWVHWSSTYEHLPDAAWVRQFYPNARTAVRTTSLTGIITAVQLGLGIGLVPHGLAGVLGNLCEVPQPNPILQLPLWLVGHRAHKDVARIRIVRAFVERSCASLTPE